MATFFAPETVVKELFSEITKMTDTFTQQAYASLSHVLAVPLGAAITLYIALLGVSISQGWIKMSMGQLVKSALLIGLIYTFSMNWDWFSGYFMELVTSIINTTTVAVMNAGFTAMKIPAVDNIGSGLQMTLNNCMQYASYVIAQGHMTSPMPFMIGFVVIMAGLAVVGTASGLILVSQILLALLFGIAPFIIIFALFKPTQRIFDNWLGAITGTAMAVFLISSSTGLVLTMFRWVFPVKMPDPVTLATIMAPMIVMVVSVILLFGSALLGQRIGGGVCAFSERHGMSNSIGFGMNAGMSLLNVSSMLNKSRKALPGMAAGFAVNSTKNVANMARRLIRR